MALTRRRPSLVLAAGILSVVIGFLAGRGAAQGKTRQVIVFSGAGTKTRARSGRPATPASTPWSSCPSSTSMAAAATTLTSPATRSLACATPSSAASSSAYPSPSS
ncbi:hypothetical protein ACP70R_008817 [Stipagrostis hirtigluma subsp. patula]